jgi:hypothetical protein
MPLDMSHYRQEEDGSVLNSGSFFNVFCSPDTAHPYSDIPAGLSSPGKFSLASDCGAQECD